MKNSKKKKITNRYLPCWRGRFVERCVDYRGRCCDWRSYEIWWHSRYDCLLGESWLRGTNPGIVGVIAYVSYLLLSIIIPSSSGLVAASMPIIAPVAGGIAGREVAIVAFATASGLLNMMAPTIASLMAGLSIAGVSYKAWVKRTAPIMVVFALISLAVIFTMGIL